MPTHMTPTQLAERWQRPASWIRQQANAGAIPAIKLGHTWRFDLLDIEAFETRHKTADPLSLTPGAAARRRAS